jgi:diguanylate cyclase (GGDEF)-like protein
VSQIDDLLHGCSRLLLGHGRAASVTVFAAAAPGAEQEQVWLHEGSAAPLPELADPEAAARFLAGRSGGPPAPFLLPSSEPNGRLIRCGPARGLESAAAGRRRAADGTRDESFPAQALTWIGLRFTAGDVALPAPEPEGVPLATALDAASSLDWTRITRHLAALVEHARRITRVLVDPVTGLPGRADFQVSLDRALAQAVRERDPLAVLLVNPDDFGAINERFERDAGDEALREIARRLRASVRNSDGVCKYGGAIFTCLLPSTPAPGARAAAEKILRNLSEGAFVDGAVRLGFSVGVAGFDPESDDDLQSIELVRRADVALNAAKRAGGSQVRMWAAGEETQAAGNLDRLTGIFTGNMSKDYRNMVLLWDSVHAVATAGDPGELTGRMVERLHSTLRPDRVGIFGCAEGEDWTARGHVATEGLESTRDASHRLADDEATVAQRAWDEDRAQLVGVEGEGGIADRLCVAVPLRLQEEEPACVWLEGQAGRLSLDSADLVFLEGLASQMSLAFERARLAHQERERQEQEQHKLRTELADLRRAIRNTEMSYRSPSMETVLATARRVAPTDATVLITGESGVGKELMARTIHELSARRDQPLVLVDCGAISSTLIDSELFGHEKGAFTGAAERKTGRLAEADGATVFLDEIGELPLEVQSKLLRFVQERQITPVGSSRSRTVDARIIAATNVDLAAQVADGRFREDLFYRLNVVRLEVPPLRERPEDLRHLTEQFLEKYAAIYGKEIRGLSVGAVELVGSYEWPGNVRQLQNRIMRAVLMSDGTELTRADLGDLESGEDVPAPSPATAPLLERPRTAVPETPTEAPPTATAPGEIREQLGDALARLIDAALADGQDALPPLGRWLAEDLVLEANAAAGGVARRGAERLGVPETTFRRRMRDAARRQATGLAPRPSGWDQVRELLALWTQSDRPPYGSLLKEAERVLLARIMARVPDDSRAASALLGVSEPTLKRRLA